MKVIICLALCVVMMGGVAEGSLSYYAAAWNPIGSFIDANKAMWTAVQAAVSGCTYYCGKAWTAATVAASEGAKILRTGLYYGSIVSLGAVSVYMAYKGFTWANGVLSGPIPGGGLAPTQAAIDAGQVGSSSWTEWGVTYHPVFYTNAACPSSCTQGSAMQMNASNGDGWYGKAWAMRLCNGYGSIGHLQVCAPSGHPEWLGTVKGALTPAQVDTIVGGDLAGSNGSDALTKSGAALLAMAGAIADPYNDWRDGTAPGALADPWDNIPASGWQVVADGLASGISQGTKNALAELDIPDNALKDIVDPPTVSDLTKADLTDAIKDGIEAADDEIAVPADLTPGDPGTVEAPEKDLIGTKLDSYWSIINSIPVLSLITDLTLNDTGAGAPTIEVTVPSIFGSEGATYSINLGTDSIIGVNYSTYLTLLGNLILAFTGVVWTKYLFEG